MNKNCTKCKELKPFTEFHKHSSMGDGMQPVCIPCRKQVNADYYKATPQHDEARKRSNVTRMAIIATIIEPILLSGCVDCGKKFPVESMDFDHVRGDKTISISRLSTSSYSNDELLDILEEELKKCEAVCANCHRIRTYNRYKNSARRDYFEGKFDSKLLKERHFYLYDYLSQNACLDCGEHDIRLLELDHVTGEKVENVSKMILDGKRYSLEDVKAEILKCEVVCVICHRNRTISFRKSQSPKRGIKKLPQQCECGANKPNKAALNCRACFHKLQAESYSNLTTEEMVAKVRRMGMKPYADTIGISDNGLRKLLVRRGIAMPLHKDKKMK